jgi:lipoprotein-anchoring transpeptidase ErfK/SrfK
VRGRVSGGVRAGSVLAAGGALLLAGCSSTHNPLLSKASIRDVITVNLAGKHHVKPTQHVVVRDLHGRLTDVAVTGPAGHKLHGRYNADRTVWRSTHMLRLGTPYAVAALGGTDAQPLSKLFRFHTVTPKHLLYARISPLTGMTVGVGQPIAVYFTAAVSNRALVERQFQVHNSAGVVGRWHWYSDTEMHYRPKHFWPAHSTVSLSYDLRGLNPGPGVWGNDGRTIAFHIGASHVSKVDAATHEMRVYDDGKLIHSYPVSTGRDTLPTSSGIHVVLAKSADQIMDSATIGIPRDSPDGYYEHVPWSVRITNSGEFVHAAPWSVAEQGHSNVSHGCVNMAPADAEWFFNFSQIGDVVEVTHTSKQLEQLNGFADWNLSWKDWKSTDALK